MNSEKEIRDLINSTTDFRSIGNENYRLLEYGEGHRVINFTLESIKTGKTYSVFLSCYSGITDSFVEEEK